MKIALFHNSYKIRGGEDSMFELETEALKEYGHDVVLYHIKNSEAISANSFCGKLKTAINAPFNKSSEIKVLEFLKSERPDISHIHNWFPIISPSVYTAHQKAGVPVVQTLHNYRLGCAAASFRRNGNDCHLCSTGSNLAAVRNRCYRNSTLGSLIWKRTVDRNWKNRTFRTAVATYVCPSREVYRQHVKMGLPPQNLEIIPNACRDPQLFKSKKTQRAQKQVVYAGRLVFEKGVQTLIDSWKQLPSSIRKQANLLIIGDGPELKTLKNTASSDSDICFTGALDHKSTLENLLNSDLLVCPSNWAEPFGLTVIEAMAAGIPVIASNIGGPSEIVTSKKNGLLVPPENSDALKQALLDILSFSKKELDTLSHEARSTYEKNYTPAAHAQALTKCFENTLKSYAH